jgi:ribosomal protein S18 acetylase RimI-like enzyme
MEAVAKMREPARLMSSQRDQASEVLTRAFQDDPMYAEIIPDIAERVRSLRWLWRAVVKCCLLYGQVHTTPAVEGAACWLPPGSTNITFWRSLRAGMALAVMRFPREAQRRLLDIIGHTDELHKRLMGRPHWYLMALGVDPPFQGHGIGGRLLRPVLVRSDEDGLPCYLETQTERNVEFYQRRGFDVVSEGEVPGYSLRIWVMVREPQS